jgi:hypothetical protein
VLHVPVGHRALDRAVLTHRRYRHAVRERHRADRHGGEKPARHDCSLKGAGSILP